MIDVAIRDSSYNSCAFWYQTGLLLIGIILLSIKSYRTTFITAIKNNGKKYFSLNITNEIINLFANLLVNFANLAIPIALANVLNGLQGAFVFALGLLALNFCQNILKKTCLKKLYIKKLAALP